MQEAKNINFYPNKQQLQPNTRKTIQFYKGIQLDFRPTLAHCPEQTTRHIKQRYGYLVVGFILVSEVIVLSLNKENTNYDCAA